MRCSRGSRSVVWSVVGLVAVGTGLSGRDANAGMILLAGGTGGVTPSIQILEDIVVTVNPGASFSFYEFGFMLPGVVQTPVTYIDTATPSPTPGFVYKTTPSATAVSVNDWSFFENSTTNLHMYATTPGSNEAFMQPGGTLTFKAGTTLWALGSTTAAWVNPGSQYNLTPSNFYATTEAGPNFNAADVSVSVSAVPEPSTFAITGSAGVVAGLIGWRRRRAAQGVTRSPRRLGGVR
ncbi:MAG: PEP-CTERM sorting domain-containing protein [Planctomycetaceae bacterium]